MVAGPDGPLGEVVSEAVGLLVELGIREVLAVGHERDPLREQVHDALEQVGNVEGHSGEVRK